MPTKIQDGFQDTTDKTNEIKVRDLPLRLFHFGLTILILVLHQGHIVQKGSHHELMDVDGLYRHMYELQRRSQSLEADMLN